MMYRILDQEVRLKSFLLPLHVHHGIHQMKILQLVKVPKYSRYLLCLYFQVKRTRPVLGE
jgi:hypothetical protein